jgi:hypothetical protein
LTPASAKIQLDRFSKISQSGVSISFLDTANRFKGWKATFNRPASWLQYNSVDFGKKPLQTVSFMASAPSGGSFEVRSGSATGPLIAEVTVSKSASFTVQKAKIKRAPTGTQHLFIVSKNAVEVNLDWITFE